MTVVEPSGAMISLASTSSPSRSTTRSCEASPSLATSISYVPAARLPSSSAMLKSSSVTVTLEPGEYVFYCSVGNHRQMGMEKTVTVS